MEKQNKIFVFWQAVLYLITTIVIVSFTIYNQSLNSKYSNQPNIIQKSFLIIQEKSYLFFLSLGFLFVVLLLLSIFLSYRHLKYSALISIICMFISTTLLGILLIVYSSPVLLAACITGMVGFGLLGLSN